MALASALILPAVSIGTLVSGMVASWMLIGSSAPELLIAIVVAAILSYAAILYRSRRQAGARTAVSNYDRRDLDGQ